MAKRSNGGMEPEGMGHKNYAKQIIYPVLHLSFSMFNLDLHLKVV